MSPGIGIPAGFGVPCCSNCLFCCCRCVHNAVVSSLVSLLCPAFSAAVVCVPALAGLPAVAGDFVVAVALLLL